MKKDKDTEVQDKTEIMDNVIEELQDYGDMDDE